MEIETVRGFPIIGQFRISPRPGYLPARVILVDRGEQGSGFGRYVVAVLPDGSTVWDSGTYCTTLPEAVTAFALRINAKL